MTSREGGDQLPRTVGQRSSSSPSPPPTLCRPTQRAVLTQASLVTQDHGRQTHPTSSSTRPRRLTLDVIESGQPSPLRGHRKSSSITSPPPPPPDFNPPPDFSSDSPLHGIETPLSIGPPNVVLTSTVGDADVSETSQRVDEAPILDASPNVIEPLPSTLLPRPQIRSLQRVSTESVRRVSYSSDHSTGSGGGPGGSLESGDVLAARRDELVSHLLSGVDVSAESSQHGSPLSIPFYDDDIPIADRSLSALSSLPPSVTVEAQSAQSLDSANQESAGDESTHAWDSVWPGTNAVSRHIPPHPEAVLSAGSSSRYPITMSRHATPGIPTASAAQAAQAALPSSRPSSLSPRSPPQGSLSPILSPNSPSTVNNGTGAMLSESSALATQVSPVLLPSSEGSLSVVVGEARAQSGASSPTMGSGSLKSHGSIRSTTGRIGHGIHRSSTPSATGSTSTSSRSAEQFSPLALGSPVSQISSVLFRAIEGSTVPEAPGLERYGRDAKPARTPSLVSPPAIINQWNIVTTNNLTDSNNPINSTPFPISGAADTYTDRELGATLPLRPSRIIRRLSETALPRRANGLSQPDRQPGMVTTTPFVPLLQQASPTSLAHNAEVTDNTSLEKPKRPSASGRRAKSENDVRSRLTVIRDAGVNSSVTAQAHPSADVGPDSIVIADSDLTSLPDNPQEAASPALSKGDGAGKDADLVIEPTDAERHRSTAQFDQLRNVEAAQPVEQGSAQEPPTTIRNFNSSTASGIELVDEGDVLPTHTGQFELDATFDDEGLNTLERIFLLSRSEYTFHRAYVARVLGDLLYDVDPCESVEYVLPLVSGFSLDDDDSVKEAFAAELHRILWYFYSTCKLVDNTSQFPAQFPEQSEEEPYQGPEGIPGLVLQPDDGTSLWSPGSEEETVPEAIHRLEAAVIPTAPLVASPIPIPTAEASKDIIDRVTSPADSLERGHRSSTSSTGWSHYSSYGLSGQATSDSQSTPITVVSADSPRDVPDLVSGFEEGSESKMPSFDDAEEVEPPILAVDFFTPLLGTLLLSQNPSISDPVREGIAAVLARLRGHGEVTQETWGSACEQSEQRQMFLSQTGPHSHGLRSFDSVSRAMVAHELLHGIVLGMGTLSTDMPDSFFDHSVEIVGGTEDSDTANDKELFSQQMIHEATLGRALSLSLIGGVCELYSPEEVVELGFVDEVIRGLDGDENIRSEAAIAISHVARAAPYEVIPQLIPVFEELARDESEYVRQSSAASWPTLIKRIEDPTFRRLFAVNTMYTLLSGGEDVREAALEAIGDVIYAFQDDPLGPPPQLLEVYCDDRDQAASSLEDSTESAWDQLASYNFPGVALTLGPNRWEELRGLFGRLVSRAGDQVLLRMASFIHELAQILHPGQVAEDILPLYKRCLELHDQIRERIFEHVDVFFRHLPPATGWECFSELAAAWEADSLGGWRAREQLALHMPSFFRIFREPGQLDCLLGIMRSALLDPFAAVREAATFSVPPVYEVLTGQESLKFHNLMLDLSLSQRFRHRLTFVNCLKEFVRPPPNKSAFEQFFLPALPSLANDVVDVRLALAKAVSSLFIVGAFYGDQTIPLPKLIRLIISALARDEATDVRDIIERVGSDRWAEGQEHPADALSDALASAPEEVAKDITAALQHAADIECQDGEGDLENVGGRVQLPTRPDGHDQVEATADRGQVLTLRLCREVEDLHSRAHMASPALQPRILTAYADSDPITVTPGIGIGDPSWVPLQTKDSSQSSPQATSRPQRNVLRSPTDDQLGDTPGKNGPPRPSHAFETDPFAASFARATPIDTISTIIVAEPDK